MEPADRCSSRVYLTSPGLHVEHVGRVVLQGDDLGEVHVLVEELRTREVHQQTNGGDTGALSACISSNVKPSKAN